MEGRKVTILNEQGKQEVKALTEEVTENGDSSHEFIKIDKQETVEDSAKRYSNMFFGDRNDVIDARNFAYIEGAEWQRERSYSEGDLREAFRNGQENMNYSEMHGLDSDLTEQQWFEQFKKE